MTYSLSLPSWGGWLQCVTRLADGRVGRSGDAAASAETGRYTRGLTASNRLARSTSRMPAPHRTFTRIAAAALAFALLTSACHRAPAISVPKAVRPTGWLHTNGTHIL